MAPIQPSIGGGEAGPKRSYGGREGSSFSQGGGGGCANASFLSRIVTDIDGAGSGAGVFDAEHIVIFTVFHDLQLTDVSFQSPSVV